MHAPFIDIAAAQTSRQRDASTALALYDGNSTRLPRKTPADAPPVRFSGQAAPRAVPRRYGPAVHWGAS
jgi:hypothetical protein